MLAWANAAGLSQVGGGVVEYVVPASSSTSCLATPEDRQWWGGMWADRVRYSDFARHAQRLGLADEARLQAIADGWLTWAAHPDGWLSILHGEILASDGETVTG